MGKKKNKYVPKKDDDWDAESVKKFRLTIKEKSKAINEKYRKWWDKDKHTWKKDFPGHNEYKTKL